MNEASAEPKRRDILLKIGLAVGSVVVLLASLEFGSYLFGSYAGPAQPMRGSNLGRYERYDYDLFWSLRPFATSPTGMRWINSDGMRGPELPPKAEGEYRILNLGESSTFGVGVEYEQSYAFRLGQLLDDPERGKRVQSLNAGVPGYTSFQGMRYLLERSEKFAPDLVTMYFGFNDYLRVTYLDGRGGTAVQTEERGLTDRELFEQRSATVRRFAAFMAEHSNFFRGMLQWLKPDAKLEIRTDPRRVRVPSEDRLPILTKARDYCRKQGIELVIIVPIYREFDLHAKLLRENAATLGLPLVDLPALVPPNFNKPREEYFRDPIHPGPEGHRLIAEAIRDVLAPLIR